MDKLQQIKLALYEKNNKREINDEDLNLLLERAEELYGETVLTEDEEIMIDLIEEGIMTFEEVYDCFDLSNEDKLISESTDNQKEKSANKIYKESLKRASDAYTKDLEEIKSLMNNKKYKQAVSKVKEAQKDLNKIKSIVESTPSTIWEDGASKIHNICKKTLTGAALCGLLTIASSFVIAEVNIRDEKKKVQSNIGDEMIRHDQNNKNKNGTESKQFKDYLKNFKKDEESYINNLRKDEINKVLSANVSLIPKNALAGASLVSSLESGKIAKNFGDYTNYFKFVTVKKINKNLQALEKIKKKCIKKSSK